MAGTDDDQRFETMTAKLTFQAGQPVGGAPIDFSIGGETVCAGAMTDASGVATCDPIVDPGYLPGAHPDLYAADFAGQGSSSLATPWAASTRT